MPRHPRELTRSRAPPYARPSKQQVTSHSRHSSSHKNPVKLLPARSQELPPELASLTDRALRSSLAKSTQSNYNSALRSFQQFCEKYGIPQECRFPIDERILCAFVGSHAGITAGGTAANRVSALKTLHALRNLPWQGGVRLGYVLRGVANAAPSSTTRPVRPPVTTHMLHILHTHLDLASPRDLAVFALALVAFWGQCRLGELVAHSRRETHSPRLPSIKSVTRNEKSGSTRELHLPCTKTSQRLGEMVILTRQDGPLDPVRAIAQLIRANGYPDSGTNLFTYRRSPKDGLRAITKEVFLGRCNEIWTAHGIQRITGHSFRCGGTSELLERGIAPEVVKQMGRWKSEAFYRYWRGLGSIAAKHAAQASSRPRG
ncbi:hypothetical protein RhiJN_12989 [Ceratobasidium sp. AG-Ba]|nr:hypothetical protein RhiJN_12989 [Ceratobasidium sp. AG-Ba]QRW13552.1 hypothetical protein RhiLY_12551 [Ceratobasidium sp. AG-Ba]